MDWNMLFGGAAAVGTVLTAWFAYRANEMLKRSDEVSDRRYPMPRIVGRIVSIAVADARIPERTRVASSKDRPIKAVMTVRFLNLGMAAAFDVRCRVLEDGFPPECQPREVQRPKLDVGDFIDVLVPVVCVSGAVLEGQWTGEYDLSRTGLKLTWHQSSDPEKVRSFEGYPDSLEYVDVTRRVEETRGRSRTRG